MEHWIVVTLTVCLFSIPGCSDRQIYAAIQKNRRLPFENRSQPQYEVCIKDRDVPYEDYKKAQDKSVEQQ